MELYSYKIDTYNETIKTTQNNLERIKLLKENNIEYNKFN